MSPTPFMDAAGLRDPDPGANLMRNRSMPGNLLIPVLSYPDVSAAVLWLSRAFGFRERLRVGDHRSQLELSGAGLIVRHGLQPASLRGRGTHAVMVRVVGVKSHFGTAVDAGAAIASPLTTYPYGERQYAAMDPWGHVWTFSETVADSDPAKWGGTLLEDVAGEA